MKIKCPQCGNLVTVNGLGRQKRNIPVKLICDTLRDSCTITLAAKTLNCSRGYIYDVLKQIGKSPKEFINNTHSLQ